MTMSAHTAERRLVKSSPELWSEVSDQESLGRRLDAFGEIRITGTDPESTVAWEGDAASGTVAIESAGWGTKVTLTVEVEDLPAAVPAATETAPPAEVAAEPEPQPEPEPTPQPAKQGFFARLFNFGPAIPDPPLPEANSDEPEVTPGPEVAPQPEPILPPEVEPEISTEVPEPAPLSAEMIDAILQGVLDDLGAAHHRPFSRS